MSSAASASKNGGRVCFQLVKLKAPTGSFWIRVSPMSGAPLRRIPRDFKQVLQKMADEGATCDGLQVMVNEALRHADSYVPPVKRVSHGMPSVSVTLTQERQMKLGCGPARG
jgi:hypothetical protein